jgi:hypothetical protein
MIKPFCGAIVQSGRRQESERRQIAGVLDASASLSKQRYAVPDCNIVKLIQPVNVEDQLTGVQRALAVVPSACRFQGEKSLLFAETKTKWKIFDKAIICSQPFMRVRGKMSNDKLREVKREVVSELRRPGLARVVTTQPVREVMDRQRRLSDRFRSHSDRCKIENDDVVLETFTLPLEAARLKVRDIIDGISRRGYQEIVERWRQLPNGLIEFTVRHLPIAD